VGSDRPRTGGFFMTRYAGIPETGWSGLSVAIGVMIAVVVMITGTIIVAIFDPEFDTTAGKDAAQLMVALSLGGTAFGFALHDARGKVREAFGRLGLGARITLGAIGLALLAWLIYIVFAAVLTPLLQPNQQDVTRELGTDKNSALSIAIAGILIVVLAPLSEELFFRGFMFASLRRSMSLWPAALIAAVVWGALHLSGGNIGVAIQLSVFGVILAWLYERSGTLWAPITAHALNNTIAFVLLLTDVT
jgi:membrane protease YdiL (CAAX protease family)